MISLISRPAPTGLPGGRITYILNPAAIAGQVLITEFMADNKSTIRDEDGQYSDWLELYNSGDDAVDLGGWYLTDTATNLTKWRFPQGVTLLSRAYMLVWASGKDRTNAAAPLHTNFKLSKTPAVTWRWFIWTAPQSCPPSRPTRSNIADVSYGRDRVDPSIVGYFTNATPGAANASLGAGFAPAILFSCPQPDVPAVLHADSQPGRQQRGHPLPPGEQWHHRGGGQLADYQFTGLYRAAHNQQQRAGAHPRLPDPDELLPRSTAQRDLSPALPQRRKLQLGPADCRLPRPGRGSSGGHG